MFRPKLNLEGGETIKLIKYRIKFVQRNNI